MSQVVKTHPAQASEVGTTERRPMITIRLTPADTAAPFSPAPNRTTIGLQVAFQERSVILAKQAAECKGSVESSALYQCSARIFAKAGRGDWLAS